MSWSIEFAGSKPDAHRAVDDSAASPHGMPAPVALYLHDAIDAVEDAPNYGVHVQSNGHRPTTSAETATVKRIQISPRS